MTFWDGPQRARHRIRPGALGPRRQWIRTFLRFHGYSEPGESTKEALRRFQARNGAPATGNLNWQTCRLLNARRCSHPAIGLDQREDEDRFYASPFQPARIVLNRGGIKPEIHPAVSTPNNLFEPIHCRWTRRTLRFACVGAPPGNLGARAWEHVRRAFETWTTTGEVAFIEARHPDPAEIRVLWTPGPSADPASTDPFYGPGGTLAVGYYPFPHYQDDLAGDLHLDLAEAWSLDAAPGSVDIQTVVLHEIGHCLGIGHCTEAASVMYEAYKSRQRNLTALEKAELARKHEGLEW